MQRPGATDIMERIGKHTLALLDKGADGRLLAYALMSSACCVLRNFMDPATVSRAEKAFIEATNIRPKLH